MKSRRGQHGHGLRPKTSSAHGMDEVDEPDEPIDEPTNEPEREEKAMCFQTFSAKVVKIRWFSTNFDPKIKNT